MRARWSSLLKWLNGRGAVAVAIALIAIGTTSGLLINSHSANKRATVNACAIELFLEKARDARITAYKTNPKDKSSEAAAVEYQAIIDQLQTPGHTECQKLLKEQEKQ